MPFLTSLSSFLSMRSAALEGINGFCPRVAVLASAADVLAEGVRDASSLRVLSLSSVFNFLF
jgi:hypothetical protein